MGHTSRLCLICGQVSGSDAERRDHMAAEHPGRRVSWVNKAPVIVDEATGATTRIGPSALKRMRVAARRATGVEPVRKVRVRRPAKPAAGPVSAEPAAPVVETPIPDDPDAPPYFAQVIPPMFTPAGEPAGPTVTGPEAGATVSRETLRLALDAPMLAEIIRNASIMLSEQDGAGEAGHFSRTEAGQLAMLLHDPTLDLVARYFGGNVNRFRLALAAVIILLGKGRVHLRAINARRVERAADDDAESQDAAWQATQPVAPVAVPVPSNGYHDPEPPDPIAELARRQHQWNTTPRPES